MEDLQEAWQPGSFDTMSGRKKAGFSGLALGFISFFLLQCADIRSSCLGGGWDTCAVITPQNLYITLDVYVIGWNSGTRLALGLIGSEGLCCLSRKKNRQQGWLHSVFACTLGISLTELNLWWWRKDRQREKQKESEREDIILPSMTLKHVIHKIPGSDYNNSLVGYVWWTRQ